jgi:hypothetical protein
MPGKRNPRKLTELHIKVPSAVRRQRPGPILDDACLLQILAWWAGGKIKEISAELQAMCNFRLADLLVEKQARQPPRERALAVVSLLTSDDWPEGRWSETHAIAEVARMYRLEVGSLTKAWQRRKMKR